MLSALFEENERKIFASYPECALPTLSQGDGLVDNLDDLLNLFQEQDSAEHWFHEGFGFIGVASSKDER